MSKLEGINANVGQTIGVTDPNYPDSQNYQEPDHRDPRAPQPAPRTADLVRPSDFRGGASAEAAALRPDAEEGALAWGYLAIVGLLFLGLVFFAWACQDEDAELVGGVANTTDDSIVTNDTLLAQPNDTQQTISPPVSSETEEAGSAEITAEQIATAQSSVDGKLSDTKILFDSDESTIQSGESVVAEVAAIVKDLDVNIKVEGYTDSVGDEDENKVLSEERAQTIKDKLIAEGIDSSRISIEGFGESEAVQDDPSDEQKVADRRIEIKVLAAG